MKLIGERIILRPLKVSDAERFVKWFNDPGVHKFLGRRRLKLKEERAWIRSIPKKKDQLHLAIDTKEGIHIGSLGFHTLSRRDNFAVLGIMIGDKRQWSRGYGREAMTLLLDHGFKKLKLHRIELEVYDYNPRAIKLYRRLGFKLEGRKRERVCWKGKYCDEIQMGILRREWLERHP